MKQIQRTLALLLSLCMALSLCACGGGGDGGGGGAEPGREADQSSPASEDQEDAAGKIPPLSEFIQSSDTQIIYHAYEIDKTGKPDLILIKDGMLTTAKLGLTFGELSKMSDEEIIQAVETTDKPVSTGPCFVYVNTDSSGNYVKEEILTYAILQSTSRGKINLEWRYSAGGAIYESRYTGYQNSALNELYVVRGEHTPFVRDELDTEGLEIDPSRERLEEVFQSLIPAAAIELLDGTTLEAPSEGNYVVHAMTGGGQKTPSPQDVSFSIQEQLLADFGFEPNDQFLEFGIPQIQSLLNTMTDYYDASADTFLELCWEPIQGQWEVQPQMPAQLENYMTGTLLSLRNYTNSVQTVNNLDIELMTFDMIWFTESGEPGGVYGYLTRKFGAPACAVGEWDDGREVTSVSYYWRGDGFYLWSNSEWLYYINTNASENDLSTVLRDLPPAYHEALQAMSK